MSANSTIMWYQKYWSLINKWLSEMAAKDVDTVYIGNFEFVPGNLDKSTLIEIFNADSSSWRLGLDEESDLVCKLK